MKLAQPSMRRTIIACLLVPALTGCGGGGGGGQDDKTQATSPAQSGGNSQQATHQGTTLQPEPSQEEATAGGNTTLSQDAHDTTQAQAQAQAKAQTRGGEAPSTKNQADTTPGPQHPEIQSQGAQQVASPYAGIYGAQINGKGEYWKGSGFLVVGVDTDATVNGVLFSDGTNGQWRPIQGKLIDSTLTVVTHDAGGKNPLELTLRFTHTQQGKNHIEVSIGKNKNTITASMSVVSEPPALPADAYYKSGSQSWITWDHQTTHLSDSRHLRVSNTDVTGQKIIIGAAGNLKFTGLLDATGVPGLYKAHILLTEPHGKPLVKLDGSAIAGRKDADSAVGFLLFATGENAHMLIEATSVEP